MGHALMYPRYVGNNRLRVLSRPNTCMISGTVGPVYKYNESRSTFQTLETDLHAAECVAEDGHERFMRNPYVCV